MKSLVFDVGAGGPEGPTALDLKRLKALGPGRRISRAEINDVCGTASAGNQWLDKATAAGYLVPYRWGKYLVARDETLDAVTRIRPPLYRQLVAWAAELPRVVPSIAFLAPRIWRDTELNLLHPAPLVPWGSRREVAPQLAAMEFDLQAPKRWEIPIIAGRSVTVHVPSIVDTLVILLGNAHPLWRETGLRMAAKASETERRRTRQILHRLQRADGLGPDNGDMHAPEWWAGPHRRGVEHLLRAVHVP